MSKRGFADPAQGKRRDGDAELGCREVRVEIADRGARRFERPEATSSSTRLRRTATGENSAATMNPFAATSARTAERPARSHQGGCRSSRFVLGGAGKGTAAITGPVGARSSHLGPERLLAGSARRDAPHAQRARVGHESHSFWSRRSPELGGAARTRRPGRYMLPIDFCASFMCIMQSSIFLLSMEVFANAIWF